MAQREIVLFNSQNPRSVSAFYSKDEFISISEINQHHLIGICLQDKTKVQVFQLSHNEFIPYWIGDNSYAVGSSDRYRYGSIKDLLINLSSIETAYTFDKPDELALWLITNN